MALLPGVSAGETMGGRAAYVRDNKMHIGAFFGAVGGVEGREGPEDLRALIETGCESGPGFLFTRSLLAEQFAGREQTILRRQQVLPFDRSLQRTGDRWARTNQRSK